jgi:hypothetical protein
MMPWPETLGAAEDEQPDTLSYVLELHDRLRRDYLKALGETERLRGKLIGARRACESWRHVAWAFCVSSFVLFVLLLWELLTL